MNKKLVLSVLSTAVVASMAASAMAKPNAGFYVGGNVDKYYSIDAFLNHLDTALDEIIDNLGSTTFVDENGKAAPFLSALNAQTEEELNAVTEPARLDHFEKNPYTIVDGTGSYNPEEDEDLLAPEPGELKVESVSAINALKLAVKFGADVDAGEAANAANYNIVGLGASPINNISYDETTRTATIILNAPISNGTTFVVTVQPIPSKDDSNAKTELFTKSLNFSDTVKPSFVSVSYPEAGVAKLKFSEELSAKGTVKIYDGQNEVNLQNELDTEDASVLNVYGLDVNKEYKVVLLGAKDQSGNLISPNPTEVLIKSTVAETVPPTITSVTSVDLQTLKIQFSEKLKDIDPDPVAVKYADVSVGGNPATGAQSFDSTTNTLTVDLGTPVAGDGVYSVVVKNYTDLSNNKGADFTKAVSFVAGAPILEKTEVKTIGGVKTAVLTFNEDVVFNATGTEITGTLTTPDNVLKTIGNTVIDEANDVTAVGKELRIKLTNAAFEAGTYKLAIPAGAIEDTNGVATTTNTEFTFTLSGSVDTAKPGVVEVYLPGDDASADGGPNPVPRNEVYVKFNKSMGSSAVNAANYTIEGRSVFSNAVFVGDKTLVKLTLTEGAISLTGDQEFGISTAVKGENNVAIDAYKSTEPFVENVKPTLASATLVDGTHIKVKFSEVMEADTLEDADDFEVIVNGLKKTIDAVTAADGAGTDDDEFVITFSSALTADELANGTIQVKLLADSNATDIATVANPVVGNVTKDVQK